MFKKIITPKKAIIVCLIFATVAICASFKDNTKVEAEEEPGVWLCTEKNFRGNCLEFHGETDVASLDNQFHKNISSIKIVGRFEVSWWEAKDFGKKYGYPLKTYFIYDSQADLDNLVYGKHGNQANVYDLTVNDVIQSFKIRKFVPGVYLYEHMNFEGAVLSFPEPDSQEISWIGPEWNDRISSVKIIGNYNVILYKHSNFRGRSIRFTKNDWRLRFPKTFNDKASSLKVNTDDEAGCGD